MIRTYLGAFAARVFAAIADAVAFLLDGNVFVFTSGTQAIAQAMTLRIARSGAVPPNNPLNSGN